MPAPNYASLMNAALQLYALQQRKGERSKDRELSLQRLGMMDSQNEVRDYRQAQHQRSVLDLQRQQLAQAADLSREGREWDRERFAGISGAQKAQIKQAAELAGKSESAAERRHRELRGDRRADRSADLWRDAGRGITGFMERLLAEQNANKRSLYGQMSPEGLAQETGQPATHFEGQPGAERARQDKLQQSFALKQAVRTNLANNRPDLAHEDIAEQGAILGPEYVQAAQAELDRWQLQGQPNIQARAEASAQLPPGLTGLNAAAVGRAQQNPRINALLKAALAQAAQAEAEKRRDATVMMYGTPMRPLR